MHIGNHKRPGLCVSALELAWYGYTSVYTMLPSTVCFFSIRSFNADKVGKKALIV